MHLPFRHPLFNNLYTEAQDHRGVGGTDHG